MSRETPKDAKRFLILGYTGYGNIGDELMAESAKRLLVQAFGNVEILSLNPGRGRFDPLNVIRSIRKSDGIVVCGGNLFQDETSLRNFLYYWAVVRAAIFFKKNVFFLNQGLGPLHNRFARKLLRSVLSSQRVRGYFRDEVSLNYAKRIDPKFQLCWDTSPYAMDDLLQSDDTPRSHGYACVIPKRETETGDVVVALEEMKVTDVQLVAFQPNMDRGAISRLADALNKRGFSTRIASIEWKESLLAVKDADFVITYRLHGALTAAYMGVPFVAFNTKKNRRVLKTMDPRFDLFFEDATSLMISLSNLDTYDFDFLKRKYREELEKQKGIIIEELKRTFSTGGIEDGD